MLCQAHPLKAKGIHEPVGFSGAALGSHIAEIHIVLPQLGGVEDDLRVILDFYAEGVKCLPEHPAKPEPHIAQMIDLG